MSAIMPGANPARRPPLGSTVADARERSHKPAQASTTARVVASTALARCLGQELSYRRVRGAGGAGAFIRWRLGIILGISPPRPLFERPNQANTQIGKS